MDQVVHHQTKPTSGRYIPKEKGQTFPRDHGLSRTISGHEHFFQTTLALFFHIEMQVIICSVTWGLTASLILVINGLFFFPHTSLVLQKEEVLHQAYNGYS